MFPPRIRMLFGNDTDKGGYLIVEGDKVRFITSIGRTVAGDDCCAGLH